MAIHTCMKHRQVNSQTTVVFIGKQFQMNLTKAFVFSAPKAKTAPVSSQITYICTSAACPYRQRFTADIAVLLRIRGHRARNRGITSPNRPRQIRIIEEIVADPSSTSRIRMFRMTRRCYTAPYAMISAFNGLQTINEQLKLHMFVKLRWLVGSSCLDFLLD